MNAGRNVPASVRARLLALARQRGDEFQLVLDRYAAERLLYRLSVSGAREDFVLKGALLFAVWFDAPHRPTRDADLLGLMDADADRLRATICSLCANDFDDGMQYDPESVSVREIREAASYGGLRVKVRAMLGNAHCSVQIDVGFGDAMTPGPQEVHYPSLLPDLPAPRLRAYSRETACAEKLEAIVRLGLVNSRVKDYFDLNALVEEGAMDRRTLVEAIGSTFGRRRTRWPDALPEGLTPDFAEAAGRRDLWDRFIVRNRLPALDLDSVVARLGAFFEPLLGEAKHMGSDTNRP